MSNSNANKIRTLSYFKYLADELKRKDVSTCLIPLSHVYEESNNEKFDDDLDNKLDNNLDNKLVDTDSSGDFIDDQADNDQTDIDKSIDINEQEMCYDYNIPVPMNKISCIIKWIDEHEQNVLEESKNIDYQEDNASKEKTNTYDELTNTTVSQLFAQNDDKLKMSVSLKTNPIIHDIRPMIIEFGNVDAQDISEWLLKKKNIDIQQMKKIRKRERHPMYKTKIKNICEVYKSLDDCIDLIYAFAQDPSVFDSCAIDKVTDMEIHKIDIIDENNILFVADLPGSSYECDTCHFDLQYNEKINAWCSIEGDFVNGNFSIVVMDIPSLLK